MRLTLYLLILALLAPVSAHALHPAGIAWQEFSPEAFQRASTEKKLVLLSLEAVWCHWCHVMDEKTYSDEEVRRILGTSFVAIRADQDAYPDLANRYRDYGWPATIVLNAKGEDLLKLTGYVPAARFRSLLTEIVEHPIPHGEVDVGEPAQAASSLTSERRVELSQRYERSLDRNRGGLNTNQKFLHPEFVEWALIRAEMGSRSDEEWVRLTLDNNMTLLDPVWGGAYQYSTHRDWDHPHFEKIMQTQARNIRLYATAYSLFHDARYKSAAESVTNYVRRFLQSPAGIFYVSQDADLVRGEHSADYFRLNDAARIAKGTPHIDMHMYARENGWMAESLAVLYGATGEAQALREAEEAIRWAIRERALTDGALRHDQADVRGPFLGDTLAVARAALELYSVTGNREHLATAEKLSVPLQTRFINGPIGGEFAGFFTAAPRADDPLPSIRVVRENLDALRLFTRLFHYTGRDAYRAAAEHAFRFVNSSNDIPAGILIAGAELGAPPLHLTVVGHKDDPAAMNLFREARGTPVIFKRVEWWDKREGGLPNPDVTYPELATAAAYICTNQQCSFPMKDAAKLRTTVQRFREKGREKTAGTR